jgi:hypothetical protein
LGFDVLKKPLFPLDPNKVRRLSVLLSVVSQPVKQTRFAEGIKVIYGGKKDFHFL